MASDMPSAPLPITLCSACPLASLSLLFGKNGLFYTAQIIESTNENKEGDRTQSTDLIMKHTLKQMKENLVGIFDDFNADGTERVRPVRTARDLPMHSDIFILAVSRRSCFISHLRTVIRCLLDCFVLNKKLHPTRALRVLRDPGMQSTGARVFQLDTISRFVGADANDTGDATNNETIIVLSNAKGLVSHSSGRRKNLLHGHGENLLVVRDNLRLGIEGKY